MSTAETLKKEGLREGQSEGRIEASQVAVMDLLETRFEAVPSEPRKEIAQVESSDRLRILLREAYPCPDLEAFATGLGL